MIDVYVYLSLICAFYFTCVCFLAKRSDSAVISARSHKLLFVFCFGNFAETCFIFFNIYSDAFGITDKHDKELWLINAGIGISHFIVYFPYILRAYRIYLIFALEENFEDYIKSENYLRTTQTWLLKALFYLFLPVILFYSAITLLSILNDIKTTDDPVSPLAPRSIYICIIIFFRFLEQLSLIFANYKIRWVLNDFNMAHELTLVTMVYISTPALSFFINFHKDLYWFYILRNFILLLITVIFPVILSYFNIIEYELLTADMLGSFDMLMLHNKTLSAFIDYLKNCEILSIQEFNNKGYNSIDLLLSIECWIECPNEALKRKIIKKIQYCVDGFERNGIEDLEYFDKIRKYLVGVLKNQYFNGFLNSPQMKILRREACRHEMYQIKVNYTSLQRPGEKINFVNHDWPLEKRL